MSRTFHKNRKKRIFTYAIYFVYFFFLWNVKSQNNFWREIQIWIPVKSLLAVWNKYHLRLQWMFSKKNWPKLISLFFLFFFLVRPYRTDVVGAGRAVEEGTPLSLMCRTWGARPAAVITWFNGSRPFSEQPAGQVALQVRLYFNRILPSILFLILRDLLLWQC